MLVPPSCHTVAHTLLALSSPRVVAHSTARTDRSHMIVLCVGRRSTQPKVLSHRRQTTTVAESSHCNCVPTRLRNAPTCPKTPGRVPTHAPRPNPALRCLRRRRRGACPAAPPHRSVWTAANRNTAAAALRHWARRHARGRYARHMHARAPVFSMHSPPDCPRRRLGR